MSTIIKKVVNTDEFKDIFEKYFLDNTCFIKLNGSNIQVYYKSFIENRLEIQIDKDFTESNLMFFTRSDNEIIVSKIALIEKTENNIYAFSSGPLQFLDASRKEDRKAIEPSGGALIVKQILPDFLIAQEIKKSKKSIDMLKDRIFGMMENSFFYEEIFFSGEKVPDPRMKYFLNNRRPIVVQDILDPADSVSPEFYNEYKVSIYESDKHLKWSEVRSEISTPILFKNLMPVGYLQINHNKEVSDDDVAMARKLGISCSDFFTQQKIIEPLQHQISLKDLSNSGCGLFFTDRTLIKYFKDNSYIYLGIQLPDNKIISTYAIVRNINIIKNKIYFIGCEFIDIDALGEAFLDEFLSQ